MIDTYLIIYIILCRLFELLLSRRNTSKLLKEGGVEYYKNHYKYIVFFHVIFIFFFLIKSMNNTNVNMEYLYAFLVLQLIRYKIISDLGFFWTTRIIVIEKPLVNTFLFKYFKHPNYVVVILEIILVCLFFDDLIALIFFTFFNSILICIRIFYEEKANKFRKNL
tara:strand:- start:74 stop:568 length:495 start_codon:yes stop_codon:yes gene_type:complete